MSKVWLTSDTHFGHYNAIRYCNRPWSSVDEMNQGLVDNWNSVVGKNDSVYHMGDFTLTTKIELVDEWLGALNGTIRLIKGNHDNWTRKFDKLKNANKIKWVRDYAERHFVVDEEKHKVVMCHFPMLFWHGSHYGSIHVHGHCHGGANNLNQGLRRVDVGVDCNNYKPVELNEVVRRLKDVKLNPHHNEYNDDE